MTASSIVPEPGRLRFRVTSKPAILAVLALTASLLGFTGVWTLGLSDMWQFQPPFADTVAILAAGQAHQAGIDIYAISDIDPLGRPHVYGPGWLVTGMLGLTIHDGTWVGALLAVAFTIVAAFLLAPRTWRGVALGLALLCSPPIQLGVSRGNNDLVVFLLLAIAAWLLARPGVRSTLGAVLLGTAAVLKLYPFAVLPTVLLSDAGAPFKRRLPPWLARLLAPRFWAAVVLCGFVLWVWRDDFSRAIAAAPNPRTTFAYGVPVMIMTAQALGDYGKEFVGGWIAGLLLVALPVVRYVRSAARAPDAPVVSTLAFVAGALAWLFCFFTIRSFPYRMVLLLLPARSWLENDEDSASRNQLLLWCVAAWLDAPKGLWAPLAAADPTISGTPWLWFKLVVGIEQGMILGLSLGMLSVLGIVFFRWLRRP